MNNRVTICHSTTYEKPQKSRYFRPSDPFVISTPHFLGSKFEVFLTKSRSAEFENRVCRAWAFEMILIKTPF